MITNDRLVESLVANGALVFPRKAHKYTSATVTDSHIDYKLDINVDKACFGECVFKV